jgi:hypothetical protein
MPTAPIEHEAKTLDGDAGAGMVAEVRASALRATLASLDQLAASLPGPIVSISLRAWPPGFPDDVVVLRRPPYESRADSVMYCQVLSECAHVRGWAVHLFDAKAVEAQAARILGVAIGHGTGLISALREPLRLDLIETRRFPSGTAIHVHRPKAENR